MLTTLHTEENPVQMFDKAVEVKICFKMFEIINGRPLYSFQTKNSTPDMKPDFMLNILKISLKFKLIVDLNYKLYNAKLITSQDSLNLKLCLNFIKSSDVSFNINL